MIPMGIPGMGKSTFCNNVLKEYLEKKGMTLDIISSDKVRKKVMDE